MINRRSFLAGLLATTALPAAMPKATKVFYGVDIGRDEGMAYARAYADREIEVLMYGDPSAGKSLIGLQSEIAKAFQVPARLLRGGPQMTFFHAGLDDLAKFARVDAALRGARPIQSTALTARKDGKTFAKETTDE